MKEQNKGLIKKRFTSWKAYTFIAVVLWLISVLLSGNVVGNVIMVVYVIFSILAIIYIIGGIFGKKDRDALIKRGKESLTVGICLMVLYSLFYTSVSGRSIEIVKSIFAMNGTTRVMLLSLILAGIVCVIRGYVIPKDPTSNVVNDSSDLTQKV